MFFDQHPNQKNTFSVQIPKKKIKKNNHTLFFLAKEG
jgi:hypothetical protein